MATVSTVVSGKTLNKSLSLLKYLIPSGTSTIPILISLNSDNISIICMQQCVYKASIPLVEESTNIMALTVLYNNVVDLIPNDESIKVLFDEFSVAFQSREMSISFPIGYSTVEPVDVPTIDTAITNSDCWGGFQKLLNLTSSINQLYKTEKAFNCTEETCLIAYPNILIKSRVNGFNLEGQLSIEHVKLVRMLQPTHYCVSGNTAWFTDGYTSIMVPLNVSLEDDLVHNYIEQLDHQTELALGDYADKIRIFGYIDKTAICRIAVYSSGIRTSIHSSNIEMALTCGNCDNFYFVQNLPVQVWYVALKAFGSGKIQLLTGKDILCLRSRDLIMLIRALN